MPQILGISDDLISGVSVLSRLYRNIFSRFEKVLAIVYNSELLVFYFVHRTIF
jgi:hypothetical protein